MDIRELLAKVQGCFDQGVARGWLQSPAAWSQFGLLIEGQAAVGDSVEMKGGGAGRIVKMMACGSILEPSEGRWIVLQQTVAAAVAARSEILTDPAGPDCELRGFGESGANSAADFRVNGIDGGSKKYASDVRFRIWNATKTNNIDIRYSCRAVEVSGPMPLLTRA